MLRQIKVLKSKSNLGKSQALGSRSYSKNHQQKYTQYKRYHAQKPGDQSQQKGPKVVDPNPSGKTKIDMIDNEKSTSTKLESMEPSFSRNYKTEDPTIAKVKGSSEGPNEQSRNWQKEGSVDQTTFGPEKIATAKNYEADSDDPANIDEVNVGPSGETQRMQFKATDAGIERDVKIGQGLGTSEPQKKKEEQGTKLDKEKHEKNASANKDKARDESSKKGQVPKDSYEGKQDRPETNTSKEDKKGKKVVQGDIEISTDAPEVSRDPVKIAKDFPNVLKEKITVSKEIPKIREKIDFGNPLRDLVHENNLQFATEEEAIASNSDNRRGVDLPKEPTQFAMYDNECEKAISKGPDIFKQKKITRFEDYGYRNLHFYRDRHNQLIDISLLSPSQKKASQTNTQMLQVLILILLSFFCHVGSTW